MFSFSARIGRTAYLAEPANSLLQLQVEESSGSQKHNSEIR